MKNIIYQYAYQVACNFKVDEEHYQIEITIPKWRTTVEEAKTDINHSICFEKRDDNIVLVIYEGWLHGNKNYSRWSEKCVEKEVKVIKWEEYWYYRIAIMKEEVEYNNANSIETENFLPCCDNWNELFDLNNFEDDSYVPCDPCFGSVLVKATYEDGSLL